MYDHNYMLKHDPVRQVELPMELATPDLKHGTVVKLVGDMKVDKITDSADESFGFVLVPDGIVGRPSTIRTQFRMVLIVTLAENVTYGDYLEVKSSSGTDTDFQQKWGKIAGSPAFGNVTAMALQTGITDGKIKLGIF